MKGRNHVRFGDVKFVRTFTSGRAAIYHHASRPFQDSFIFRDENAKQTCVRADFSRYVPQRCPQFLSPGARRALIA